MVRQPLESVVLGAGRVIESYEELRDMFMGARPLIVSAPTGRARIHRPELIVRTVNGLMPSVTP